MNTEESDEELISFTAEEEIEDIDISKDKDQSEDIDHYSIVVQAPSVESDIEELFEEFREISMNTYKAKSFKFEDPFIIYPYKRKRQKKVALDVIVFSQETENFKASFNKSGTQILLYTKLPELFTSKKRVTAANTKLEEDTSKAVAFEEAIGEEDLITKRSYLRATTNYHLTISV